MSSVFETLERRVYRQPDTLLFSFLSSNGEETERHTYGTFLERVGDIASHLASVTDLAPGDRLLLVYPPGLELIAALFACARAGLIPVPVPPPTPYGFAAALQRVRHIASDCSAKAVLTTREHSLFLQREREDAATSASARGAGAVDLTSIITDDVQRSTRPALPGVPSDVFLLQYTSGSTNNPKGVMVTQANVLHNCRLAVDHDAPVTVSWLPQYHDMGLLGYYVYIALTGGTTYGFAPTSFIQRPALWLETITRYRATASSAPNFAFDYCLWPGRIPDAAMAGIDLSSLRYLMAAAEPIRPDTYRRFLNKFQPRGLKPESFFVAYGLAENTLAVTNYGRSALSVSKTKLAEGVVHRTRSTSGVGVSAHYMSCGLPLEGNTVRIVNPESRRPAADGEVGEIWVSGASKCAGYWNNPELTREIFSARLEEGVDECTEYLRTGDMGFLSQGQLYVCGRRKDMIIVRGQNFFPQDIEAVVEKASPLVRHGGVAAFELDNADHAPIGVIAEVANRKTLPDGHALAASVRNYLGVDVGMIAFIAPKAMPRTSSGKTMRYMAKRLWSDGALNVLAQLRFENDRGPVGAQNGRSSSPFAAFKRKYQFAADETRTLVEVGMDSLDMVVFLHELRELLEARDATILSQQIDFSLIQRVSIADIFRLVEQFEQAPDVAVEEVRCILAQSRERHLAEELAMMDADRSLAGVRAEPRSRDRDAAAVVRSANPRTVLLTGGTGFLGPFLLKSLLEQTDAVIHVLTRARCVETARTRLWDALNACLTPCASLTTQFATRVQPVCGALDQPRLGLSEAVWRRLAEDVDTVYHNAATVNYLFSYASMRAVNVEGTRRMLEFGFDARVKQFNHVSTTFVFGWATKPILHESDRNAEMSSLDFGYSQTKWVAEQQVFEAARRGLPTRVFRPSLITPSVDGRGSNIDITIRLLAFMIKHGIAVDTLNQVSFVPADVTARNIVAIANQADTVSGTFHITRDEYSNMVDVVNMIGQRVGRCFDLFPLREFVPEIIRRCTSDDPLYPLLDFLVGSVDNIAAMEFKRYDNSSYRAARDATPWGVLDPPLEETIGGILTFMSRRNLI